MKVKWYVICVLAVLSFLSACGPDTILVRPGLDTPSLHVQNGLQLLELGKIEDARREFLRAKELDPRYLRAHVGLGLVFGLQGDFQQAMVNMEQAKAFAETGEDHAFVRDGYDRLNQMRRDK